MFHMRTSGIIFTFKIMIVAAMIFTSCGLQLDPVAIVALIDVHEKAVKNSRFSEIQQFYLSGRETKEIMDGCRLIENVKQDRIIDISRIIFRKNDWHEYFYINQISSNKLIIFLINLDNKPIRIPDETRGSRIIKFNKQNFSTFLEAQKDVISTVTIYEQGFISFYLRDEKSITVIPFGEENYHSFRACFITGL